MSIDPQRRERHIVLRRHFPIPFLVATIAYCIFIYSLSSMTASPVPPPFPGFDKLVHFFLYAGLATLIVTGLFKARYEYKAITLFLIPAGFCFLYAISDEVHQLFVEGRNFDIADIAADTLGATIAILLLLHRYGRNIRKGKR